MLMQLFGTARAPRLEPLRNKLTDSGLIMLQ
jgi:hypothetical protein